MHEIRTLKAVPPETRGADGRLRTERKPGRPGWRRQLPTWESSVAAALRDMRRTVRWPASAMRGTGGGVGALGIFEFPHQHVARAPAQYVHGAMPEGLTCRSGGAWRGPGRGVGAHARHVQLVELCGSLKGCGGEWMDEMRAAEGPEADRMDKTGNPSAYKYRHPPGGAFQSALRAERAWYGVG